MKYNIFLAFVFSGILFSCSNKVQQNDIQPIEIISSAGVRIPIYDYNSFKPLLELDNDTTYVINFWATWCKPCVKELPYFEQINDKYSSKKLRVILVSLDFKSKTKELLIPFVKKKGLKSKVILLSDSNTNHWINEIDKNWSGAIPATIIKKGKSYQFFEKEFEFDELDKLVSKSVNK